jgi:hypothetical protein
MMGAESYGCMDVEKLFGYTTKVQHDDLNEQIWKGMHAETIRVIWYARCSKVFEKDSPSMEALKGMIRYRVQTTFSLCAASPRAAQNQIQAWLNAFPCLIHHTHEVGSSCTFHYEICNKKSNLRKMCVQF